MLQLYFLFSLFCIFTFFTSFFLVSGKKSRKQLKRWKMSEKRPKNYSNQLLGAHSTQKLVKMHNNSFFEGDTHLCFALPYWIIMILLMRQTSRVFCQFKWRIIIIFLECIRSSCFKIREKAKSLIFNWHMPCAILNLITRYDSNFLCHFYYHLNLHSTFLALDDVLFQIWCFETIYIFILVYLFYQYS